MFLLLVLIAYLVCAALTAVYFIKAEAMNPDEATWLSLFFWWGLIVITIFVYMVTGILAVVNYFFPVKKHR